MPSTLVERSLDPNSAWLSFARTYLIAHKTPNGSRDFALRASFLDSSFTPRFPWLPPSMNPICFPYCLIHFSYVYTHPERNPALSCVGILRLLPNQVGGYLTSCCTIKEQMCRDYVVNHVSASKRLYLVLRLPRPPAPTAARKVGKDPNNPRASLPFGFPCPVAWGHASS